MSMPTGNECYNVDCNPVAARGFIYSDDELIAALNGPVSSIVRDDTGNTVAEELLIGIVETGFQQESVRRILSHQRVPEDWRVGEAIGEGYLGEHRECFFPWPAGRDQKNPGSSPTGADLVGFQKKIHENKPHCFAFGEVKTSNEKRWPPQTMYGRHGMVKQIETLRDKKETKDKLVMYLGHRYHGSLWQEQFKEAAFRYLADSTDLSLFGVLIRDVEPNENDLKNRAETLVRGCPEKTSIELTAIYLPPNSINGIGNRVLLEEGNHARN